MPIKWKTSEVETPEGKVKVTHWAKHDPRELIEALQHDWIERKFRNSVVTVYKFGPHLIASKTFSSRKAASSFETLRELERKRLAIVETPVALVELQGADSPAQVVTLYKKGTETLGGLFDNLEVPVKTKRKAALSAVAKLARLHAAGFIHGHLHEDNVVVDEHGNAQLIDYKFIEKLNSEPYFGGRGPTYFNEWGWLIYGNSPKAKKFNQLLRDYYNKVGKKAQKQTS